MTAFHRSARWVNFTQKVRPIITASLPQPCTNPGVGRGCDGVVYPGQRFDVGHRVDHHLDPFQPLTLDMVGPSHPGCNRKAGAKAGRAKQLARQRNDQRLPAPGSGW